MKPQAKVLIVDLNNIWNKYLYARQGDFSKTLGSILCFFKSIYTAKEFNKVYIVADGKPSERYEEFKEYKSNRQHRPDRYIPMKVLTSILGQYFTVVGGKHVEGDDVTAYLATRLVKKNDTYIYSNDKDFLQLMNLGVKIIKSFKRGLIEEVLSDEEALSKFKDSKGHPLKELKHILPYRVFKGDSSDNIPPACKGLLDKYIREIVYECWIYKKEFNEDTLTDIMLEIPKEKIRLKVKENKDNILRNYKLMDLTHIPDSFKENIKRICYKPEPEAIKEYLISEALYRW